MWPLAILFVCVHMPKCISISNAKSFSELKYAKEKLSNLLLLI